jgi:hypothetical protein
LLSNNLADHEFTDFQQLPPWRVLVPPVADEIARFTGQHLVAVQTVLVEDYWQEIETGLIGLGHSVFHVVLDADQDTLHARIDADENGVDIRKWRHEHVDPYLTARHWMLTSADLVINTSDADAESAAAEILQYARQAEKSISKVG